jgi:hypothetical protein
MTYIAPVAERVAGFSAADLTWVLVIVGVGLVIGKRDPIQYALETDWPVGAAGLEPLHQQLVSRRLHCCRALRTGRSCTRRLGVRRTIAATLCAAR